jgi:hypothetical protein
MFPLKESRQAPADRPRRMELVGRGDCLGSPDFPRGAGHPNAQSQRWEFWSAARIERAGWIWERYCGHNWAILSILLEALRRSYQQATQRKTKKGRRSKPLRLVPVTHSGVSYGLTVIPSEHIPTYRANIQISTFFGDAPSPSKAEFLKIRKTW